MKVELIYAPGCGKCIQRKAELRSTAEAAFDGIEWRELNVLDSIDYAVELGVLSLPAIAIDGVLVFTSLPTAKQLYQALQSRSRRV